MRCPESRPYTQAARGSAGARLYGADTGADLSDGPSGVAPDLESEAMGLVQGRVCAPIKGDASRIRSAV